ncbi:MAG: glycosyltransferase [Planctomycetia bacterium]|jgi:glycosyltransferase involved in cell wall biosynthesis|nr:glycosyltransferase [Planctomycetia bacterium]
MDTSLDLIRGNIRGCLEASHRLLLDKLLRHGDQVGWRQFLRESNRIGTYGTACGLIAYSSVAPYDVDTIECVAKCLAQMQRPDGSWQSLTIAENVGLTTATCYSLLALLKASASGKYTSEIQAGVKWLASRINDDGSVGNTETDHEPFTICGSLTIRALSAVNDEGQRVHLERAAGWLLKSQNEDGGFGPTLGSNSTLHHTSEAILAIGCISGDKTYEASKQAGAFLLKNHRLGENRHQDIAYITAGNRQAMLPHTYQTDGLLLQAHLRLNAQGIASRCQDIALWIIQLQKDGYWEHDLHVNRAPSWSVMECTLGLCGYLATLGNEGQAATGRLPSEAKVPRRHDILVVATEWRSRHGGLSTFNREICKTFVRAGHTVACLVPYAESLEYEDAKAANVTLCTPPEKSQLWNAVLYRRPSLPAGFSPTLVVGHGRITGQFARAQVEDNFPQAQRVHFLHMIPDEIEWYKENADAAQIAEGRVREEKSLCINAIPVGVGPRITREFATHLHSLKIEVQQFDPGLNPASGNDDVPSGIRCLVLGRAEDLHLKGLDIAARAVSLLPHPMPNPFSSAPILYIRGAQPSRGAELQRKLQEYAAKSIDVRVLEYSSNEGDIADDIQSASVVMMPSRAEGFGLVAIEAIGAGRPVLVSERSGFAELLSTVCPTYVHHCVVATSGNLDNDGIVWSNALERVLRDRKASFQIARELRDKLSTALSWDMSAAQLLTKTKPL